MNDIQYGGWANMPGWNPKATNASNTPHYGGGGGGMIINGRGFRGTKCKPSRRKLTRLNSKQRKSPRRNSKQRKSTRRNSKQRK